jgi:hypothetical protein
MRRLTIATLLCGALLVWAGVSSGAISAPPPGPRLAIGVWRGGSATGSELLTVGPSGEDPRAISRTGDLVRGPKLERPVWNATGTELAFYGPGDETPALYLVGADGTGPRLLATSEHPGGPDNATLSEPLFDPKTGEVLVAVVHTPNGEGLFGDERPDTRSGGWIRTEFWELPTDGSKGRRLSSRPLSRKQPLIPIRPRSPRVARSWRALSPDGVSPSSRSTRTRVRLGP